MDIAIGSAEIDPRSQASRRKHMRIGKVVFIAVAVLIVYSGIAHAITVKKKRDAPGEPAAVWALIGSFCAIKNWHPAVADCETSKEGDVTSRTLTLEDGSKYQGEAD